MSSAIRRALRLAVAGAAPLAAFGLVALLLATAISTGLLGEIASRGARGALETLMGEDAFWVIVTLVLVLFGGTSGHYGVMGAKHFSHDGKRFEFFSLAIRVNHFVAAVSCTTLMLTGATMMASAAPGTRDLLEGTGVARLAWGIHRVTAIVFAATVLFMLARWAVVMLPRKHDLEWLKIAGGYLSTAKRPIPAHKFNAGQKMWFWLATLGGLVMATTGLLMHLFVGGSVFLNFVALAHHVTATAIIAMFGVHHYMSLFAVKGSLRSMIDGYKSEEEVAIMHSLYYEELGSQRSGGARDEATARIEAKLPQDP
jgi:formate dehydrogenase subunit gamma